MNNACVRLLLRLLLVGLIALGPGGVARAQTTPDPELLGQISDQVGAISGRARLNQVDFRVLDQAALHAYLLDTFARDYLPIERESDQKLLLALGLIRPNDDVVQISLDLLSDQVLGVYDPDRKTMFLVTDGGNTFGPAAQVTFAHEFEHALQDQYYGLRQLSPKHPDNYDRALAIHAVEEGDAVLTEGLWANTHLSARELAESRRGGSSGLLDKVPAAIRSELLFPYLDGYRFVTGAYHAGGDSYLAVDELFKNPPASTAQILHPDKYRAGVAPIEVALAPSLGDGWRTINSNVLGEFQTRSVLQQYGERSEATSVASHWAGDRWVLLEKDGSPALAWETVWDSPEAAQSFLSAYGRGLRARFPGASVDAADDERQALSTDATATELRLLDSTTVLTVIAADRATAVAIVAASAP